MNSISLFVYKDIVLEVHAAAMFRCSFAKNAMWASLEIMPLLNHCHADLLPQVRQGH